jgi:hypothetical protein
MMEEWHQKLHNNSSPDDLVICQALLDYLASGQDMQVYWDSLAAQGAASLQRASFCVNLLLMFCRTEVVSVLRKCAAVDGCFADVLLFLWPNFGCFMCVLCLVVCAQNQSVILCNCLQA